MTENPVRSRVVRHGNFFRCVALFLVFAGATLSGCSMRRRPAIPWATAIQVKPRIQPRGITAHDVPEDQVPDLQIELPANPSRLLTTRSTPPRPRGSANPAGGGGNDSEKSGVPQLVPQLTAEETAAAQQQTNQSLNIAERNLESARGKRLNAAELDLVSKIKGFVKDAREAAQGGDWARARSLSKKAEVLSQELFAAH
jgi:hypothetical protein